MKIAGKIAEVIYLTILSRRSTRKFFFPSCKSLLENALAAAKTATIAIIISAAFPNVAFSNPPTDSEVLVANYCHRMSFGNI